MKSFVTIRSPNLYGIYSVFSIMFPFDFEQENETLLVTVGFLIAFVVRHETTAGGAVYGRERD